MARVRCGQARPWALLAAGLPLAVDSQAVLKASVEFYTDKNCSTRKETAAYKQGGAGSPCWMPEDTSNSLEQMIVCQDGKVSLLQNNDRSTSCLGMFGAGIPSLTGIAASKVTTWLDGGVCMEVETRHVKLNGAFPDGWPCGGEATPGFAQLFIYTDEQCTDLHSVARLQQESPGSSCWHLSNNMKFSTGCESGKVKLQSHGASCSAEPSALDRAPLLSVSEAKDVFFGGKCQAAFGFYGRIGGGLTEDFVPLCEASLSSTQPKALLAALVAVAGALSHLLLEG